MAVERNEEARPRLEGERRSVGVVAEEDDNGDDKVDGIEVVPAPSRKKRDVDVAAMTVDARPTAVVVVVDRLKEPSLGGTKVEPVEIDVVRLRLLDAERMSCDRDVVAVTVEARERGVFLLGSGPMIQGFELLE